MISNLFFFNRCFDKNRLKAIISWSLTHCGEKATIELVENLKDLGFQYATQAGISLGLDDLKTSPTKPWLVSQAEIQIHSTQLDYQKGDLTAVEKFQQLIDTWHRTSETLKQNVVQHFRSTDILNPVYMMAFSGARGNISQVRQLVGMRGLMADPQGQIIDFPIRSNFREGLTLTEYVISCYGARKGLVDTALRTANSGYLTRRLVDVSQHVIVSQLDCKTRRGIYLNEMKEGQKTILSLQNRLIGRVLAENLDLSVDSKRVGPFPVSKTNEFFLGGSGEAIFFHEHKKQEEYLDLNDFKSFKSSNTSNFIAKNEEISSNLAAKIVKLKKKVLVRSALTCESKNSICQLCYGWSLAHGNLVSLGEAVGILAAQSIGEPGTQLTMRTFHTGGVFSGDVMDEIRAPFDGIVEYGEALQGTLIRTPHGKIAFLTKVEGEVLVKSNLPQFLVNDSNKVAPFDLAQKQDAQKEKTFSFNKNKIIKFRIPSSTILFVREGEFIVEKQLIAEFSSMSMQTNQRIQAKHNLNSEIEGQVFFENVFLGVKIGKEGDITRTANKLGSIWILAGKLFQSMVPSVFFPKTGDLLDTKSIINQSIVFVPSNGFLETTLKTKKIYSNSWKKSLQEYSSKEDFVNDVFFNYPLFSLALKTIRYKKYGYFLSSGFSKQGSLIGPLYTEKTSKYKPIFNKVQIFSKYDDFYLSNSIEQEFKDLNQMKQFLYLQWFPEKYRTQTGGLIIFDKTYLNENLTEGQFFWVAQENYKFNLQKIFFRRNLNSKKKLTGFRLESLKPSCFVANPLKRELASSQTNENLHEEPIKKYFNLNKKKLYISNKIEPGLEKIFFSKPKKFMNKWIKKNVPTLSKLNFQGKPARFYTNFNGWAQIINPDAALVETSLVKSVDFLSLELLKKSNLYLNINLSDFPRGPLAFAQEQKEQLYSSQLFKSQDSPDSKEMIYFFKTPLDFFLLKKNRNKASVLLNDIPISLTKISSLFFKRKELVTGINLSSKKMRRPEKCPFEPFTLALPSKSNVLRYWKEKGKELDIFSRTEKSSEFFYKIKNKQSVLIDKSNQMNLNWFLNCKNLDQRSSTQVNSFLDEHYNQFNAFRKKQKNTIKVYCQNPGIVLNLEKSLMFDLKKSNQKEKKSKFFKKLFFCFINSTTKARKTFFDQTVVSSKKIVWKKTNSLGFFPLACFRYFKTKQGTVFEENQNSFAEEDYSGSRKSIETSFFFNKINSLKNKLYFQKQNLLLGNSTILLNSQVPFTQTQISFNLKFFFTLSEQFSLGKFRTRLKNTSKMKSTLNHNILSSKLLLDEVKKVKSSSLNFYDFKSLTYFQTDKFLKTKQNLFINSRPLKSITSKNICDNFSHKTKDNIKLTIKPGWMYFPKNKKQAIKNNQFLCKPGYHYLDDIIFDQHMIYVECLLITSRQFKSFKKLNEKFRKHIKNLELKENLDFCKIYKNPETIASNKIVNASLAVPYFARHVSEVHHFVREVGELSKRQEQEKQLYSSQLKNLSEFLQTLPRTYIIRSDKTKISKLNNFSIIFFHNQFINIGKKQDLNASKINFIVNSKNRFYKLINLVFQKKNEVSEKNNISNFLQNKNQVKSNEFDSNRVALFALAQKQEAQEDLLVSSKIPNRGMSFLFSSKTRNLDQKKYPFSFINKDNLIFLSKVDKNYIENEFVNKKISNFVVYSSCLTRKSFKPKFLILIRKANQYPLINNYQNKRFFLQTKVQELNFRYDNLKITSLPWFNKQKITKLISRFPAIDFQIHSFFRFKTLGISLNSNVNNSVFSIKKKHCLKEINLLEIFISLVIPNKHPLKLTKIQLIPQKSFQKHKISNFLQNKNQVKSIKFDSNRVLAQEEKVLKTNKPPTSSYSKLQKKQLKINNLKNFTVPSIFYSNYSEEKLYDNSSEKRNLLKKSKDQTFAHFNSLQKTYKDNIFNIYVFNPSICFSAFRKLELSSFMNSEVKNKKNPSNGILDKEGIKSTKLLLYSNNWTFKKNPVSLTSFFSPYKGEITNVKTDLFGKQSCLFLSSKDIVTFSTQQKIPCVYVGKLIRQGDQIINNIGATTSGQIIQIDNTKVVLRKAQPILFSSRGVFHVYHGDFVEKNSPLLTLFFQRLKTGDIVQGIPKIEQFFEARQTKEGEILPENLHDRLHEFFENYKQHLSPQEASRKALEKIQRILVDGVQKVYQSQGVTIAEKHLEVIVRQMTSKVRIIDGGQTGLLRGELIDLDWIEVANKGIKLQKAEYEPIILGITKAALETESFISASSFQETTRILARAAVQRKTDFLKGLKENVILGHLIPAGTGFSLSFDPETLKYSQKKKIENDRFFTNIFRNLDIQNKKNSNLSW